ncbi:MAG: von Willebrand factor type A domain-containing protein [Planctomycetes bacterium]|nr:von Willebrand factor type A domain-containing protein [Planctomycetota bacterium]
MSKNTDMHCEKAEMLMAEMIYDDYIHADDKDRLLAHLDSCQNCSAAFADMKVTAGLLRSGIASEAEPKLSADKKKALLDLCAQPVASEKTGPGQSDQSDVKDEGDKRNSKATATRKSRVISFPSSKWMGVAASLALMISGVFIMTTMFFSLSSEMENAQVSDIVMRVDSPMEKNLSSEILSLDFEVSEVVEEEELEDVVDELLDDDDRIGGEVGGKVNVATVGFDSDALLPANKTKPENIPAPVLTGTPVIPEASPRQEMPGSSQTSQPSKPLPESSKYEVAKSRELVAQAGERANKISDKGEFFRRKREEGRKSKKSELSMYNGKVAFKVNKLSSASSFKIKTPSAVAGVRGTEYSLEKEKSAEESKKDLSVLVTDGSLATLSLRESQVKAKDDYKGQEGRSFASGLRQMEISGKTSLSGYVEKYANRKSTSKSSLLPTDEPQPLLAASAPKISADLSKPIALGFTSSETIAKPLTRKFPVNPFTLTSKDKLSTFAMDTDTASYDLARSYINKGTLPPPDMIRMEEFINAQDYHLPLPQEKLFSMKADVVPSPFGENLWIARIGLKGKTMGRDQRQPVHLTFVIDSSGSMGGDERLGLIQRTLPKMLSALNANDRISLISYGEKARLISEYQPVSKAKSIIAHIQDLRPQGATYFADGHALGYQVASRHYRAGWVNRVIILSDGVANMGATVASELLQRVKQYRKQGVTLTCLGFGQTSYNDALLEELANNGDGNYFFVDSEKTAQRILVDEFSSSFQTLAKDAKIQVHFNADKVRRFRLIGYENRKLDHQDFRNDNVDAGEVNSGQNVVALYEIEKFPGEESHSLATVRIRYRDELSGQVEELSLAINDRVIGEKTVQSHPRLFLAILTAEFAEYLRESEYQQHDFKDILKLGAQVAEALPLDDKVQELFQLIKDCKSLAR